MCVNKFVKLNLSGVEFCLEAIVSSPTEVADDTFRPQLNPGPIKQSKSCSYADLGLLFPGSCQIVRVS